MSAIIKQEIIDALSSSILPTVEEINLLLVKQEIKKTDKKSNGKHRKNGI
jgi:hypothetical protein